jgi:hypothetical protein
MPFKSFTVRVGLYMLKQRCKPLHVEHPQFKQGQQLDGVSAAGAPGWMPSCRALFTFGQWLLAMPVTALEELCGMVSSLKGLYLGWKPYRRV